MAVTPELASQVKELLEKGEDGGMVRHMSTLMELLKSLEFIWKAFMVSE